MFKEQVSFLSDGARIAAEFYKPANVAPPYPTVVMGGGWCCVKEPIQPDYAKYLVDAGYACLIFDYRHLGESDGEPLQHINPWARIHDYRDAMTYVSSREDVDGARIGVWGISYSGTHALVAGALGRQAKVIVSVLPMLNGLYNMRCAMSNDAFREFLDLCDADRIKRFKTGEPDGILHCAHPHETLSTFPAPETWPLFKKFKETVAQNHEH